MGLFKDVKKPVIRQAAARGADISPLRPKVVPKASPCLDRCPAGTDVRAWLTTIAQAEAYGRTPGQACEAAWRLLGAVNPFPATLGRICPHPCEQGCHRQAKDAPVAVNAIERALGDLAIAEGFALPGGKPASCTGRVAIAGAGAAGLSCAYQLARRAHRVTVFEARDVPGGRLRDGIRTGRVAERVVDAEIARIARLGVDVRCNTRVPDDLGALEADYDVVFVATGRATATPIAADDHGRTARARVFAGGDAVRPGLVGAAIASGRRAADAIDAVVGRGFSPAEDAVTCTAKSAVIALDHLKLDYYEQVARGEWTAAVPADPRDALPEIASIVAEAKRCFSCGLCMDCERCWMYCTNNCIEKLPKGEHYRVNVDTCNGCRKCADACPCGYLEMY
jgi:Pyruvate/2-oxoacid:ferredoxin oxidoreductase delta subunit